MVTVRVKGDYRKANNFFEKAKNILKLGILDKYGAAGVEALSIATPKDSGVTASSWTYRIEHDRNGAKIIWSNTNTNDGEVIALLLQYGHGTGTGGYIMGRDYINPAMAPIFEKIADDAWREVKDL